MLRIVRRPGLVLVLLAAVCFLSHCAPGGVASLLAKPPEFAPVDQSKCGVVKSPQKPLVVEWPATDRVTLEAKAKEGVVAVRYVGCSMEVLANCRAPPKYVYTSTTSEATVTRAIAPPSRVGSPLPVEPGPRSTGPDPWMSAGEDLFRSGDYEATAAYFRNACDHGSAFSCSAAGNMMSSGLGQPKNVAGAKVLLERGCRSGDRWGCSLLEALTSNEQ
jgi:hypothetical protein